VELDHRRAEADGGGDLAGVGLDEQADPDPGLAERATKGRRWLSWPAASSPPSVVRSSRFSGTMQAACGRWRSAISSISSVAAISRFRGTVSFSISREMSSSRIWRRSSRRWAVMPSAPACGGGEGGANRIGMIAAARVPDGRDMIDVDAEAQVPRHAAFRLPGFSTGTAASSGGRFCGS
jgi:hypothetical protein